MSYTEAEVQALLFADKWKAFLKMRCGECNAMAFKKFAKTSPLVVRAIVSTFWCKDCGRILCESHRSLHTCERRDALLERQRNTPPEQIMREAKEAADQRDRAAAAALQLKKAEDDIKSTKYHLWKGRRRICAGKSSTVVTFLQRCAVQTEASHRQDELLRLYSSSNVINLSLWCALFAVPPREPLI
ncbi:hypothetical protein M885DRAFT_553117 [Pelagophyceae sp. CCMP2097]|nr:hypothetical protein M885DRAFT_553117 [Pelagophyceae sp. CCMP2097]